LSLKRPAKRTGPAASGLIPANLPGAFLAPRPPDDFDPRTASSETLTRYGLPWRPARPGDPPAIRELRERALDTPWLASSRVEPRFEPRPGVTHVRRGARRVADGTLSSNNWSGATINGTWSTAVGTWVIPSVSRPPEPQGSEGGWHCSSWVGLDGTYGTDDVLQAGVEQTVDSIGLTGCSAWFEWFATEVRGSPGYVQETVAYIDLAGRIVKFPVEPGDTVVCVVEYTGSVAPDAAQGSGLDGYSTEYNDQQHVNYVDAAGNVHEFYFDGTAWQHNNLTMIASGSPPPAAPGSPVHGYQTVYNDQQHVNYFDAAGNVHELSEDGNGWRHVNLTTDAQGSPPPAAPGSPLDGYATEYNSQQHVNYLDAAGNVHELYNDGGGWKHNDLTAIAQGSPPPAAPGSALDGYQTDFNNQQHVNYLDASGNVHELYYDGSAWRHNNLTVIASGSPPPAVPGSALDGYETGFNEQQHVNYLDAAGNVHELYYDGSAWHHNNLSVISLGTPPPAAPGSPLAGHSSEFNGQQHVNFLDASGNAHELYYDGSNWRHNNLTALAVLLAGKASGLPSGLAPASLQGYQTYYNSQQHINFIDAAGHVHELYYDGTWQENDLTLRADAAAYLPATGSPLTGYATGYDSQQHVNYTDPAGDVHELYYDGTDWLHNDLSVLADATGLPVAAGSALAGYATEYNSQQHVNYLDVSGNVHELYDDGSGWKHNDLTGIAAGDPPSAAPGSALAGYSTEYNKQQHVNYLDTAGNVHELYNDDGGGWKHNNLTMIASGSPPPAVPGGLLTGYQTKYNSQQHVNYLDASGNVHELYNDGGGWKHNDLTAIALGSPPPAVPGSALHGYPTEYNSQQHVNYLDGSGNVHELVFEGGQWQHNNLTTAAGAASAAPGSPLDGYATEYSSQQHVNYLDSSGNVRELYYDGSWHQNNLNALAYPLDGVISGAPVAVPGGPLDGYATEYSEQQHLNYIDGAGHVHELYYADSGAAPDGPSGWIDNDLNQFAGRLGAITFVNQTQGFHFSVVLVPPPGAAFTGNSAEWIMEAPDFGEPISSLPKFSQVQFTGAECTGPGGVTSDPSQGDAWNISGFGKTLTSATLATNEVTIDFTG
jgi:Peptidase A4 family/Fungal fucose-specific lectin